MEEYVRSSIEKGLRRIIFLEHYEAGVSYFESTWLSDNDFRFYHEEGVRLKEKYRDAIDVGIGVEVGYNPSAVSETKEFLGRFQWDRIGISYHYFEIDGRHYNVVSRRQHNIDAFTSYGIDRVMDGYFTGLLSAICELPGDVICHIDAALRHHPALSFRKRHWQQVDLLLGAMKEKGMALEVNTSGYRLRDQPFPTPAIILEALRCGIPLVAGSDAHHPDEVGRCFDRLGQDLIKWRQES
jgi:histidinol-phosphatase (PHP family)